VIIEGVRIQSESARWVILTLYKGAIVVLPREHFVAGLKKGKAWRRASAMRAREADAERSAGLRRSVKG
jgi:hypothetical protein